MQDIIIYNANVVTPDRVIPQGAVVLRDHMIEEVTDSRQVEDRYPHAQRVDAAGRLSAARLHRHPFG